MAVTPDAPACGSVRPEQPMACRPRAESAAPAGVSSRRRPMVVSARAAGRAQAALRIEQEHAGGDDPLAFREPERTSTRSASWTPSVTGRGSNDRRWRRRRAADAGIHDGITWNGDRAVPGRLECSRAVQTRPQVPVGLAAVNRTRSVRVRSVSVG